MAKAKSADDLTQYVALRWLNCFLTHPMAEAQDAMMPYMADLITAVLPCLSRRSPDIRDTAVSCNSRLLSLNLSKHLNQPGMRPVLAALSRELSSQQQPTRLEALQWFQVRLTCGLACAMCIVMVLPTTLRKPTAGASSGDAL